MFIQSKISLGLQSSRGFKVISETMLVDSIGNVVFGFPFVFVYVLQNIDMRLDSMPEERREQI